MAFSRTPRTVRPKDPRDVASPHPLSDAALGSSLLLDVLVGARRAVARSTRHDVRALFPVRYRGGAKPAAPGELHTRARRLKLGSSILSTALIQFATIFSATVASAASRRRPVRPPASLL